MPELLGIPTPRINVFPEFEYSFGEESTDLMLLAGIDLFEWQQIVLDTALGVRSDGKWSASTVGLSVSRQAGKSALIEARALTGVLLLGERQVVISAHEQKTNNVIFKRMRDYLTGSVYLKRLLKPGTEGIHKSKGEEGFTFADGAEIRFLARSNGSGRGFSPDCLLLDEAQMMSADEYEAILGSVSAKINPQVWLCGTPPPPNVAADSFARLRASALSGDDKRAAWFEYSPPDDCDIDDHHNWALANPAWGLALQTETIERERAQFSEDGFCRERLGMWVFAGTPAVIDADMWNTAAVDDAGDLVGAVSVGVDISPDRSVTSIAVAGIRQDGRFQVELVAHRAGTDWLLPKLLDLVTNHDVKTVVVEGAGAAVTLALELERERLPVHTTTATEWASACGLFYDSVVNGNLTHLGDPALATAVSAGRKRQLEGRWAWARKNTDSDITPVCAATLALFGSVKTRKRARRNTTKTGLQVWT
ncbi:terminase TerL endonuclease subunit [Nocardia sp. CA-128927]|uniref:terminase TerL endonuclease subunit n=1 Tax=Nocardia sp. CA-128927 TaxID=3239975 RepID=UPI003D9585AE